LTTIEAGGVRSLKDSPWGRENKLPYIVKKSSPKSPKFITANEIIGILKGLHSESERCMFHMQYDTGLRISELVSLRLKDLPSQSLYQDQNFSYIPLYIKGAKGKAGQDKERVSIISRAVLNRIRKYHSSVEYRTASQWRIHDPEKPVFLTSNSLMWTVRNAQKQFKTAVKRSGVSEDFVTHWMRHGTAFSILTSDIGKDYQDKMLTIQSVLGHSNISTTEIYTQISPAILTMLNSEGKKQDRLSEAEYIRAETFLSPLKHKEKRGKYER
jgi:site-specific recombinase XerD